MKPDEKPSDWDWVTARHNCSLVKMFELLGLEAEENIKTRNALVATGGSAWHFARAAGRFSVVRQVFSGMIGVRFWLEQQQIVVDSQGVDVKLRATLTLNDAGECRLLVNSELLDRWQFLRRALEPLLFRSDEL